MKHTKGIAGDWVKAGELQAGIKAKLMSEVTQTPSKFNEGKFDNVAKIKLSSNPNEVKNVRINKATMDGLIDAFGEDDTNWMGKALTVQTEKAVVAGKRVTILYLVPEGWELKENSEGYMHVVNPLMEDSIQPEEVEEISPEDIPF